MAMTAAEVPSRDMGTVAATDAPTAASRRQILETSWVIGVVLFVIVRFVIAYSTLAKYGQTTVIVFGLLDVGTAVPYALGTARVVTGMVDRAYGLASRWAMVACASFVAPYVWLAWAGREDFPVVVYVVIGAFALLLGANAVVSVARNVRAERRAAVRPDDAA